MEMKTENINPIETKTFQSFKEFRDTILIDDNISGDFPLYGGPLREDGHIYRGLATDNYTLIPTALRDNNSNKIFEDADCISNEFDVGQVRSEYALLQSFYKIANNNGLKIVSSPFMNHNYQDTYSGFDIGKLRNTFTKWYPEEFRDLAALAQHYGTPTRMLDWTQDINVALYFSSIGAIKRIMTSKEKIDQYNTKFEAMVDGHDWGEKIVIWALDIRYLQFSKYFVKKEEQESFSPLKVMIPPYCDNPNLSAQKGVLTYWETDIPAEKAKSTDKRPLDELVEEYCKQNSDGAKMRMIKYEIPINECTMIYRYLRKLGYTAARLFPGYAGVNKQIEEDREYNILHSKFIMNTTKKSK